MGDAFFGAGFALIFPALMAMAVDRVGEDERGEVLGSFTAFFDLGVGLGAPLAGLAAALGGYPAAFGVAAVAALALPLVARVAAARATAETAPPAPA